MCGAQGQPRTQPGPGSHVPRVARSFTANDKAGQVAVFLPTPSVGARPAPRGPPPGDPILDVIEETLRHQRVLVQVDEMWRLGRQEATVLAAC